MNDTTDGLELPERTSYVRVGINASLLAAGGGYRQTGVSRYIGELIDALRPQLAGEDALAILGGRFQAVAARPALRIVWEQTGLPLTALAQRLDVIHGPLNVVPLASRMPTVVTVHDVAFLHYPEHLPAARRRYLMAATKASVRRATRVIAVSSRTADDLVAWSGIDRGRVRIIPEAGSPAIRRDAASSGNRSAERPYLLAVGTLEPRKNLPFLLRVFASLAGQIPHDLVIVGPEGWMTGGFHQTLASLGVRDRVRLTGFVTDRDLGRWYAESDLFVFPSIYEGFGLPVVEAMNCGAPVLTSSSSCFPEVVGDGGMLADPADADAWAAAILQAVNDRELNRDLRERARVRARAFSWASTACATLDVYREAAQ